MTGTRSARRTTSSRPEARSSPQGRSTSTGRASRSSSAAAREVPRGSRRGQGRRRAGQRPENRLPVDRMSRSAHGLLAAIVVLAVALPAIPASGASRGSQNLPVYAVPATVQFMNHADDRLRGMSTNPFKLKAEAVILGKNGKEKGNGPFPGDDILYGFKLFADAKRSKPVGSAMFTCYYEFVKRATCDSYFDLAKGLLLASGQVRVRRHPLHTRGHRRHEYVLRRARASGLRAGRRERTAVRPPRDRTAEVSRRGSLQHWRPSCCCDDRDRDRELRGRQSGRPTAATNTAPATPARRTHVRSSSTPSRSERSSSTMPTTARAGTS